MSTVLDTARTRLETARTKLKEFRGGKGVLGSKLLGESSGGLLLGEALGKGALLTAVKEKGALGVLEERFPKIKDLRAGRLLGGGTGSTGSGGEKRGTLGETKTPPPSTALAKRGTL